jgi:hypothetical protein
VVFGTLVIAEILFLTAAAHFGDFAQAGQARSFVLLMFAAGACFIAAAALLPRLQLPRVGLLFWSVALVARIAMLPCVPGDDLWRYIWEGRVQNAGGILTYPRLQLRS